MNRKIVIALTLTAVLATILCVSSCSDKTPPVPVTVAWSPFESLGLFFVADDQGFFAENGLEVTMRRYDTGAAALNGMVAGEADIVVGTTEFPLVSRALQKTSIKTFGTIAKSEFIYVIARKDRGIQRPGDLKGKRIGVAFGTIAEFHLGRLLELNGIGLKDVTLVDLKTPDEWVNAAARGDVDAVCTAQPTANQARDALGANALVLPAQSSQALFAQAIATSAWLAANPDLAERFLRALVQAEGYIASHKAEAQAVVREQLNLDASYMDTVWLQNHYALTLDQSLVSAMEDEARWMISNNLTSEKTVPDFLDFIYEDALEKVNPDAVRIIR